MTLLYADTSAVIRAYLADEADHDELRKLLLDGSDPIVTSELTRVEFASAMAAAQRAHRISDVPGVLARFEWDCRTEGRFSVLRLSARVIMPAVRRLVTMHHLHTLDAIHLATALHDATPLAAGDPVTVVTRDHRLAVAARDHGLSVL